MINKKTNFFVFLEIKLTLNLWSKNNGYVMQFGGLSVLRGLNYVNQCIKQRQIKNWAVF